MGCNGGWSWALCRFVCCPRSRANMHENINNVKYLHWVPFILYSYRNIMRAYICYWCHRRNCRLRKIYNPFSYSMGMGQRTSGELWMEFIRFRSDHSNENYVQTLFFQSVELSAARTILLFLTEEWGLRIGDGTEPDLCICKILDRKVLFMKMEVYFNQNKLSPHIPHFNNVIHFSAKSEAAEGGNWV